MSFQFYSKLDQEVTDGPRSQLNPNRALEQQINADPDVRNRAMVNKHERGRVNRLMRRGYRKALKSNNPLEQMRAAQMMEQHLDRGGRTGAGIATAGEDDKDFGKFQLRIEDYNNQKMGLGDKNGGRRAGVTSGPNSEVQPNDDSSASPTLEASSSERKTPMQIADEAYKSRALSDNFGSAAKAKAEGRPLGKPVFQDTLDDQQNKREQAELNMANQFASRRESVLEKWSDRMESNYDSAGIIGGGEKFISEFKADLENAGLTPQDVSDSVGMLGWDMSDWVEGGMNPSNVISKDIPTEGFNPSDRAKAISDAYGHDAAVFDYYKRNPKAVGREEALESYFKKYPELDVSKDFFKQKEDREANNLNDIFSEA